MEMKLSLVDLASFCIVRMVTCARHLSPELPTFNLAGFWLAWSTNLFTWAQLLLCGWANSCYMSWLPSPPKKCWKEYPH